MAQPHPITTPLWTVVGQGAIGLLATARLHQAGYPVQLHRRTSAPFDFMFQSADDAFSLSLHTPLKIPYSFVLLPVKAYAVVDAVQQLLPLLAENAQLVLSHNGMGTIEQVLPLLKPKQGLWFLSTSHGAFKANQTTVIHSGKGQSVLGALNQAAFAQQQSVEKAMQAALGPLVVEDDIKPSLWLKLAVNAVINPLTALHQCKNGELSRSHYTSAITLLIEEFVRVANAAGQDFSVEAIQNRVKQVIEQTAENYSSMQQDFVKGRRTELEYITGFLLRQAEQHQLQLPAHQAIYQLLLQKSPR
ncbi:ketopantoate reductase family protein [Rheinheimera tangshanensis]|uniref:2-dehydropantoate 2-reductase n=1 Tax=Rheinheimera tangshanensis TaxID=400153 RepID=A0A5C8M123_9GAMM|nr:2-dehydropantoate 2-reductase [Rheinheimera tangshanensis]TXK81649.1 2-dehydropantoate 2-reductase [Rheinheimera tangshanensis]